MPKILYSLQIIFLVAPENLIKVENGRSLLAQEYSGYARWMRESQLRTRFQLRFTTELGIFLREYDWESCSEFNV